MMGSKMYHSAAKGTDGAEQGVSACTMSNDFTSYSIFLFIEGEGGKGGGHDCYVGGCGKIEASGLNKELNVFELKRR